MFAIPCPHCAEPADTVERRRLNTAYCDDELNWFTSCEMCFCDLWDMYEEQWAEYYGGQGYTYTEKMPWVNQIRST